MPLRREDGRKAGNPLPSLFSRTPAGGSSGSGGSPSLYAFLRPIDVAAAAWVSDATNPKSQGDTWYYADIAHNMNASLAVPVAMKGYDGFYTTEFHDLQYRDANTTRVWIAFPAAPAYVCSFMMAGVQ